jgi:hypothetical protein
MRRIRPQLLVLAELELWKRDMTTDEPGRGGEWIRILEQLAELARRLHRAERRERGLGRLALELEQPLHVLPR